MKKTNIKTKKTLPTLHEPEAITRGRRYNRIQRKLEAEEAAAREEARCDGWDLSPADAETITVEIEGAVVLMDRHTAYALINTRQAKLVIALETPVELIAVEGAA